VGNGAEAENVKLMKSSEEDGTRSSGVSFQANAGPFSPRLNLRLTSTPALVARSQGGLTLGPEQAPDFTNLGVDSKATSPLGQRATNASVHGSLGR
jgi:hypothetical protein